VNFGVCAVQERWRLRLEESEAAAQTKLDRARDLISQYEDTITELSQDSSSLTASAQALREDNSALSASLETARAEADHLQASHWLCMSAPLSPSQYKDTISELSQDPPASQRMRRPCARTTQHWASAHKQPGLEGPFAGMHISPCLRLLSAHCAQQEADHSQALVLSHMLNFSPDKNG